MMKFKRIAAVACAAALASVMSISVSAADWSQASYADNDPNTGNVMVADKDFVIFTNTAAITDIAKCRITLDNVIQNPDDAQNIWSMTWKVTYNNITTDFKADSGLAGGAYVFYKNSREYKILPDSYDSEDKGIWGTGAVYTIDDSWTRTDSDRAPVPEDEIVFMDWSYADIAGQGVTVTISDLKLFDKDGNEIPQINSVAESPVFTPAADPERDEEADLDSNMFAEDEESDLEFYAEEPVDDVTIDDDFTGIGSDDVSSQPESVSGVTSEDVPKTGDIRPELSIVGILLSLGMTAAVVASKRKNNEDKD